MTGNKRNILFITGTRADFGKLKSLMHSVESDPAFNCHIFATGMHLLKKYGKTIEEIRKEKFQHIFPFYNQSTDTSRLMDISLAETIKGISFYITDNKIDLLIVHGDRIETLAGAIVGALNGIRTAHIEGGERSGTVDEVIRHSVSKLAHLHFVSRSANRRRLLQMGERESSIFVIGSPDIDIMLGGNLPTINDVKQYYGINFKEYSILIYHPVVSELEQTLHNITEVVEAIKESDRNYVIIQPNNDLGSSIISDKIAELNNITRCKIFPSLRFEYFLTLIRHAQCVLGNSSCGIHEAPIYGVPTLNIGTRQNGRFVSESIFNVQEDKNKILEALNNLPDRCEPIYTYGKGDSAVRFMKILHDEFIWNTSLQKSFHDLKNK